MFHSHLSAQIPCHRRAVTLVEILIVIAILLILSAFLFPVFRGAKDSANHMVTVSRMKQMYQGMIMYGSDYDVSNEVPGLGAVPGFPLENAMVLKPYGVQGEMLHSAAFPDVGKKKYLSSFTYFWVTNYRHTVGAGVGIAAKNRERLLEEQSEFVIVNDHIHDYFEFWPHEKDSDPLMQRRFEINLRVNGSVKSERRPGIRGTIVPYWTS